MRCQPLFFAVSLASATALITPIQNANGDVDISSLTNHVVLLEQTFNALSTKYDSKIADLETKVDTLNRVLQSTNDELTYTKSDLLSKADQLSNLTKGLAKMKTPVSYEVILTNGFFDILDHEVLKFDHVVMNEGLGYGNTSGIFTAPVTGTYLFWTHINNADSVNNLDIHIKKNNVYVVRANAPPHTLWGIASATALFHLDKGEQVWFTKNAGSNKIYGHGLSSYGGVLLTAD